MTIPDISVSGGSFVVILSDRRITIHLAYRSNAGCKIVSHEVVNNEIKGGVITCEDVKNSIATPLKRTFRRIERLYNIQLPEEQLHNEVNTFCETALLSYA